MAEQRQDTSGTAGHERPRGDPLADEKHGPAVSGGQGIGSGLQPGAMKPHGGSPAGQGSIGSGGGNVGPGTGLGSRTPSGGDRG
ncbi:hypothetical protein [Arenibaculum pallidiluteum]|uniref:hypothetical protein n=1 Tax=Arenibaculum pallidiluteum TaxID=2812559 RepID=UPI001A958A57|nr:hypothetical protein [Arenibaculum pallidiluteum]